MMPSPYGIIHPLEIKSSHEYVRHRWQNESRKQCI